MNWAYFVSVILGAGSLYLAYYGAQLANRASNDTTSETVKTEVSKVLMRIDTVQKSVSVQPAGSPTMGVMDTPSASDSGGAHTRSEDAHQRLVEIDRTFSSWAASFIKERDLKKLTLERHKLEARTQEIELSTKYRPILQLIIDDIRAAIRAYNSNTGAAISVELKDLPSNLYEVDSNSLELGTVKFPPNVTWNVNLTVIKPARRDMGLPYCQIDIQTPGSRSEDSVRFVLVPPDLLLQKYGGGIASGAKLPDRWPLDSASEGVQHIVQALVETQIFSLPNDK